MTGVLCPCNKNRLIVGSNPGVWLKGSRAVSTAATTTTAQQYVAPASANERFDEQVRAAGVCDGYPYFIEMEDGRTVYGRIESGGALPRMMTGETANDYTVYWGDDALARAEGI
ncbi:hypothetical protein CR51_12615 [Caballeronia megalochromosomata]|nr:hypothetical protein CR51_12615 [Caballeronia megalochromosomata]